MFTAGSPFTVVKSVLSSREKNVCDTVFVGPTGGSLCPMSKGLRSSILPIPFWSKFAHEIPAFEPVVPTHTSEFFAEAATVFGNVPGRAAG